MKWRQFPVSLALAAALFTVSGLSQAHGHHSRARVGVYFGAPVSPWYYPYSPFYAYPPVVAVPVAPPQPPVYVEQQSESPPSSYWYYCNSSKTYFPYVQECPEGWQKVVPHPPS